MPKTQTTDDDVIEDMITEPSQEQAVATVERREAPIVHQGAEAIDWGAALGAMLEKASDANLDERKFLVMKDALREFRQDDAKEAFARDMSHAQSECQAVIRRSEVKLITKEREDKGSYKFASEGEIDDMIRPIMTKFGFSITHDRKRSDGGLEIVSTLWHRKGHSITASFPLALDSGAGKNNLQAAGSTDSYGRKYNLLGFFNIVRKGEDDDGASANVKPLSVDVDGRKKAERLRLLVIEAGIGADAKTDLDRRAAVLGWIHERLGARCKADGREPYVVTNYLDIQNEDYAPLVRLLHIEKQVKEAKERKEAEI